MEPTAYRVNEAAIVAELFDNEAIIMNLSDGVYYTLSGTAAEIWSLIEAGHSAAQMADHLSARHGVDTETCEKDLAPFLAELVDKDIVLRAPEGTADADAPQTGDFGPYAAPTITCHTDMAEVMAMDPPLPELAPAGENAD